MAYAISRKRDSDFGFIRAAKSMLCRRVKCAVVGQEWTWGSSGDRVWVFETEQAAKSMLERVQAVEVGYEYSIKRV